VDRRSHRRFEIVGTFLGSLETWHPLIVRNIGVGGALIETADTFPRDWKLRARLTNGARRREMRVEVRHAATGSSKTGGYLVGIEFPHPLDDLEDVVSSARLASVDAPGRPERRRWARVDAPQGVEFGFAKWTTVQIADVSLSGAMFVGSAAIDVGCRAQFRARLGNQSFDAEIESRRVVERSEPGGRYGIGAAFVSMGEESRMSLASFLITAEH